MLIGMHGGCFENFDGNLRFRRAQALLSLVDVWVPSTRLPGLSLHEIPLCDLVTRKDAYGLTWCKYVQTLV